jgi:hypothetical protein
LLVSIDEDDALEHFFIEFDECLAASENARDSTRWPIAPLVRSSIPSKAVFLPSIRERPVLFLGAMRIDLLWARFAGYDQSIADLGQALDSLDLLAFERWLAVELSLPGAFRWDRILLFVSHGNQDKAFELFFSYLDHFVLEENRPG